MLWKRLPRITDFTSGHHCMAGKTVNILKGIKQEARQTAASMLKGGWVGLFFPVDAKRETGSFGRD